jgi:DNA-binding NarL/FixJ family response regulator
MSSSDPDGPGPSGPLRVVVADDHPLIRDGWQMILATVPDAVLVGSAATGAEAIRLVDELRPDLVVMDLHMPDLDGVEATRRITSAHPGVAVLVLSQYDDDESITAALRAGARGYLLKGAGAAELLLAVRTVASGQIAFGAELGGRMLDRITGAVHPAPASAFPTLTARELEVLTLLAEGLPDHRIAAHLSVEAKTVRNHIGNLLTKLPAASRLEAVLMARTAGLGGDVGR